MRLAEAGTQTMPLSLMSRHISSCNDQTPNPTYNRPVANRNLSELIERSLSNNRLELLRVLAAEAAKQQVPLYVVGGTVRDLLLGRLLNDFDLIVEGDAIGLARKLASKHGGVVTA